MEFFRIFALLLITFIIIKTLIFKKENADASNGAIIMATGIFIFGAAQDFSLFNDTVADVLAAALLALAIIIAASFIKTAINGTFHSQFIEPRIKSFAIGTWVAGISVLVNVLLQQFPEYRDGLILLAIFNGALWIFYLSIVVQRFKELYTSDLYKNAHGILLLSTVSTQSIAILYYNVFAGQVPVLFSKFVIYLGVVLYIFGFLLIFRRYKAFSQWKVADDWQNTNCILHGAMSITGLASATTSAVGDSFILIVWLWVLTWFVIVESVEIWRVSTRIRNYGINQAVGQYNATQWSRNFTFGMLYAFTMQFDLSVTRFSGVLFFASIREFILRAGAWVVFLLLVNEVLLFLKAKVDWESFFFYKKKEIQTVNYVQEKNESQ